MKTHEETADKHEPNDATGEVKLNTMNKEHKTLSKYNRTHGKNIIIKVKN